MVTGSWDLDLGWGGEDVADGRVAEGPVGRLIEIGEEGFVKDELVDGEVVLLGGNILLGCQFVLGSSSGAGPLGLG